MKKIMAVLGCFASLAMTGGELATFELTEYLGTAWSNECVTYAVDATVAERLRAGAVCKGDDGVEVPWQLTADGTGVRFIAALPEYGKRVYALTAGQPLAKTHLKVTETQEYFEIANAVTGVRISKSLGGMPPAVNSSHRSEDLCYPGQGPVMAWRLSDGTWAGGSTFTPMRKIEEYRALIVEQGAVLAKVEAVATFEGGGSWKVAAELIDGEPSFKIRETFDGSHGSTGLLTCDETSIEHRPEDLCHLGTFTLRFDSGLDPDWILFRAGGSFLLRGKGTRNGEILAWPLSYTPESDPLLRFYFQPWVWWQGSLARGHFFTLMNYGKDTAVTMITSDTLAWVDPSIPAAERATPAGWLRYVAEGTKALVMDFELKKGEREYAISVLAVAPILKDLWDAVDAEVPPSPDEGVSPANLAPVWDGHHYTYLRYQRSPLSEAVALRTTHYPLDRVKDVVLEWPHSEEGRKRPRMFLTQEDIDAFRARLTEKELAWSKAIFGYDPDAITSHAFDAIIPAYLAAPSEESAAKFLISTTTVQKYVDELLHLTGSNISLGVAGHHRGVLAAVAQFVDVWFSLPQVTAEDRLRVKGQMAFLAYVLASEEFFSPERGFAGGLLGMRTLVSINHLAFGAALVDHPLTRTWMNLGASYLYANTVDLWEADGEFSGMAIQCPHYALGDFCIAMAMLLMQEQQGIPTPLNTPKVKNHAAWYAKISTPRDPRFGYRRHLPPTGNSYLYEPMGVCGTLAYVYKDRDPAFSADMQWMDNEQGNFDIPFTGGFEPALAGARRILRDTGLPAKVPDWTSEHFKDNGVVLRSRLATEDESFLYMIAGEGSMPINHWDLDQGGLSQLWLRSVPVADDFGYTGLGPEADHTMLDWGKSGGTMEIEAFRVTQNVDYVRGRKATSSYSFLSPTGVGIVTVVEARPNPWVREIALVKHDGKAPDYFVIRDTLSEKEEASWRMWLTPKVASDELEGDVFITDKGAWMESFDGRTTHIYFLRKPADATVTTLPKTVRMAGMNAKFEEAG
ncbi:MAG: hypothetical protein FWF84_05640, partial [Kiritimatiellaeota bacterium]|nr:hypothetical protein [Kiritimatiellota bacterium]